MDAAELFWRLTRGGCRLLQDGEQLRIQDPRRMLTDALRQAIREHKAALLALLVVPDTTAPVWRCRTCARVVEIRTMFWGECQACQPPGASTPAGDRVAPGMRESHNTT